VSSGLSQEEIERLIKEAEMHVEEDKKKKELVDARNSADALIYTTEKSMQELGDKIDGVAKAEVEGAVSSLKQAMQSEDAAEINRLADVLTQASHKLAESVYQQSQPSGNYQGGADSQNARGPTSSQADDDVVDAEYEEVA
jgi:molecular chaperone DnaK